MGLNRNKKMSNVNSVNSDVYNATFDSFLTYMYINADSLLNKRAELSALIEIHKPEIIGIVEVKPKNYRFQIEECEIAIQDYEVFHNLKEEGRGICLHVKKELKPSLVELKTSCQECIFARCQLVKDETLVLGLVYRSPNSSEENNNKLNNVLKDTVGLDLTHLAVLGDFNYPEIDWSLEKSTMGENHPATKFYKATKEAYLIQHQMEPTRFRDGQRPTLDDLVLTNRDDIVQDITRVGALGKSDHATILVKLAVVGQATKVHVRPNYHKGDYAGMRQYFDATDWEKEFQDLTVNQAWISFREKTEEAKSRFIPKTKTTGGKKNKWMDRDTLETVKKKRKLYRKWLDTKSRMEIPDQRREKGTTTNISREQADYAEYAKARNKATKACKRAKIRMEATVASQAKKNPKSFWSYVKSKTGTRTGIPDLKSEDGFLAVTDKEKAETLNSFFQSVFTLEPDGDLPSPPAFQLETELTDYDITTEEVSKRLKKLNTGKAAGLDEIPPLLLVETADSLALPISLIFKKSLEEGCIPDD